MSDLKVSEIEYEIIKSIIHLKHAMGDWGDGMYYGDQASLMHRDGKIEELFNYLGRLHRNEIKQPEKKGWFSRFRTKKG